MGVGKGGQISSVGDLTEVLALAKVLACLAVGSITSPCFGNEPGLLAWRKSSLRGRRRARYTRTRKVRARHRIPHDSFFSNAIHIGLQRI